MTDVAAQRSNNPLALVASPTSVGAGPVYRRNSNARQTTGPAPTEQTPKRRPNSLRLAGYDYRSPGAYFITTCTHRRQPLFNDARFLSIVRNYWLSLPRYYPQVTLDVFVVMPNHVHGILVLDELPGPAVGAGPGYQQTSSARQTTGPAPTGEQPNLRHGVPEIVRWFKSHASLRINRLRRSQGQRVWQRGYHDHIVRNDKSLDRIRDYLQLNPACWQAGDDIMTGHALAGEEQFWAKVLATRLAIPTN